MKELDRGTVESSEFVKQTFNFWFNSKGHIRSPFPEYIQKDLESLSKERFFNWASGIDDNAKDEINEEVISGKFEEIIFEIAQTLVKTEDEKLTINYPFMPRIGDEIVDETTHEKSTITDRSLFKEDDLQLLKVTLQKEASDEIWETSFELPV